MEHGSVLANSGTKCVGAAAIRGRARTTQAMQALARGPERTASARVGNASGARRSVEKARRDRGQRRRRLDQFDARKALERDEFQRADDRGRLAGAAGPALVGGVIGCMARCMMAGRWLGTVCRWRRRRMHGGPVVRGGRCRMRHGARVGYAERHGRRRVCLERHRERDEPKNEEANPVHRADSTRMAGR